MPEDNELKVANPGRENVSSALKDLEVQANESEHDISPDPKAPFAVKFKVSELLSLLALAFSIYSAQSTWRFSSDTISVQAIKGAYDTFYDINRMQLANPDVSHMFATPENYSTVISQVTETMVGTSVKEQSLLRLKERAVALALFTIFERNLYEWKQAEAVGDSKRAVFLQEVLNYFTGRLLRNPRLVYYWKLTPGGLATYFETSTQQYYQTNAELPTLVPDYIGPFTPKLASK